METPTSLLPNNQLTDIIGLRQCGIFPAGKEPSICGPSPGLDQAPAHPASPRRTLRLLRSSRSLGPHPHQTEDAGSGIEIARHMSRKTKNDTQRVVFLFPNNGRATAGTVLQNGRLPVAAFFGSLSGRTSNLSINGSVGSTAAWRFPGTSLKQRTSKARISFIVPARFFPTTLT